MSARLSLFLGFSGTLGLSLGMSHAAARQLVVAGFTATFKRPPTLREAQFMQAVALEESGYGGFWTGDCAGSFNMGAVQSGSPPCDPATSCQHGDTHESGAAYEACFKRYPTALAGFTDLARQLYLAHGRATVLRAAQSGDVRAFSTALRASGYFELALDKHVAAITGALSTISSALHEPAPSASATASGWPPAENLAVAGLCAVAVVKLFSRYRSW